MSIILQPSEKFKLNYNSPAYPRTTSWLRFRRSSSLEGCRRWRSPEMPGTRPSSCAVSKTAVGHRCGKHKNITTHIIHWRTLLNVVLYILCFCTVVFAVSDCEQWPRNVWQYTMYLRFSGGRSMANWTCSAALAWTTAVSVLECYYHFLDRRFSC